MDGWAGDNFGPLICFILRYEDILNTILIYTYLNIYEVVRTIFLWVLKFGKVRGSAAKNQKHPPGWIF